MFISHRLAIREYNSKNATSRLVGLCCSLGSNQRENQTGETKKVRKREAELPVWYGIQLTTLGGQGQTYSAMGIIFYLKN